MGIFDFFFGKRKGSAEEAKRRLNIILEYERKKLPPNFPQMLKKDLVEVFKKYPQFDVENIEVELPSSTSSGSVLEQLRISIPFRE